MVPCIGIWSVIVALPTIPCADPEGVQLVRVFLGGGGGGVVNEGEGGSKYHYKRAIISRQVKHHINDILLAC